MTATDPPRVIVTTSWDDGHRLDLEVARLLEDTGVAGTFYIAPANRELRRTEMLPAPAVRALAARFEIGAHTMTHCDLTHVTLKAADREIRDSKHCLEQMIGEDVPMFCYPRGAHNEAVARLVRDAGFRGARTVHRFALRAAADPFRMETSIHAYRHYSDVVRILSFTHGRPRELACALSWDRLALAMFERVLSQGGVFHLWGHSWEIARHHDWRRLEGVLRHIGGVPGVAYMTNGRVLQ